MTAERVLGALPVTELEIHTPKVHFDEVLTRAVPYSQL